MIILQLVTIPFILLMALFSAEPEADTTASAAFEVDSTHSTSIFRTQHMGAGMFYGRFNDIAGTIQFVEDMPAFDITIDIASVDTNNSRLDSHLKSPDFFNVVEFPVMTFVSTSSKKIGDEKYEVVGEFSMHGVSKTITVLMVKTGQMKNSRGEKVGFETEFSIKRTDYDMPYGIESGSLADETKIIVALEAGR